MAISAQDVKKLREMTQAGMMDCKRALEEANGDFDKAIDILRKKGRKVSEKRKDREAKEGLIVAKIADDNKRGIISLTAGCALFTVTDTITKIVALTFPVGEVLVARAIAASPLSSPYSSLPIAPSAFTAPARRWCCCAPYSTPAIIMLGTRPTHRVPIVHSVPAGRVHVRRQVPPMQKWSFWHWPLPMQIPPGATAPAVEHAMNATSSPLVGSMSGSVNVR